MIVLKAMGFESDQEVVQMIGAEPAYATLLAPTLQECQASGIFDATSVGYCGSKVRVVKMQAPRPGARTYSRSRIDEARDIFAGVVLAHVPVVSYDFRQKCAYISIMIRRILNAMLDPTKIDDKDYYGNKRLELAGQLLALLFEDCFERLNADLKRQADAVLSKADPRHSLTS